MTRRRSSWSPIALLVILCVSLGALVASELVSEPGASARVPAGTSVSSAGEGWTAPPKPRLAPVNAFAEIIARPLFRPTRRPPEPVQPAPVAVATPRAAPPVSPPPPTRAALPPPPPPPPKTFPPITLLGVIIQSAMRTAILRVPNEPVAVSLQQGNEIDGWKLAEVAEDHVLFRFGQQDHSLEFPKPVPGVPAPSAGATTRPPTLLTR